jgi:hypothetical protein
MSAERITFYISEEDKLWLDEYAKAQKISVAVAVRQGIIQLKKEQRQRTYQKLIEITFGIWRQGNGLVYQNRIRDNRE